MAVAGAAVATQAIVASTALAVAGTAASYQQAKKTAAAQAEAQELRNEQVVETTVANYDQLAEEELAVQEKSLNDSLSSQKAYIASKGRVNVMAAAMGTGGQSVASQLQDLERTKYGNYSSILKDKQAQLDNISDSAENARYSGAASLDTQAISRPSTAAALLNVGSQVATGYSNYSGV